MITRLKLTQKVDQFILIESFPSTRCCLKKFPPNKVKNLASWPSEAISGLFMLGGWQELKSCIDGGQMLEYIVEVELN